LCCVLEMERVIQEWALGREVEFDVGTYEGFNRNVREGIDGEVEMSLLTNQRYDGERAVEGVRAELRVAGERAAGLEAQ